MPIRKKLSIIVVICLLSPTVCKRIPSFAGPYRIILRGIHNRSEEYTSLGQVWVKLYALQPRPGQPQYSWGESFNRIEVNDEWTVNVHISSWSNNNWVKNYFVMNFERGCSDLLFHAKALLVLMFGEEGKACPIKPGHRVLKNRTMDLKFPQFPIFPYGRWLVTARMLKESQAAGVTVIELEDIPRT